MLSFRARAPVQDTPAALKVHLPNGRVLEVPCNRHPQARRIKLAVDERGPRLSMPPRASLRSAQSFLQEHAEWLQTQMTVLGAESVQPMQPHVTLTLPLRGRDVAVRWREGRMNRVLSDGDALLFELRGNSDVARRRALRDFYEAQARADVAQWLLVHATSLPKQPSRIQFRRMTSQWGSLSPAGVVTLDLSLVLAPPEAFEYVLVHELCHLVHANHSRAYWREVDARFPHWRLQRAWFHANGRALKATLRALT